MRTPADALDAIFRLEEKLRGTDAVRFYVKLSSSEPVSADLEGSVELQPSGAALVYVRGELASNPAKLESEDDGRQFAGLARGRAIAVPIPAQFRDILAAGFVRLGLLDIVLRMQAGDLPQSGDVLRQQLRLDALAVVEPESTRSDLSACVGHAYTVRDRGRDLATATLWIDRFDGHPRNARSRLGTSRAWEPQYSRRPYVYARRSEPHCPSARRLAWRLGGPRVLHGPERDATTEHEHPGLDAGAGQPAIAQRVPIRPGDTQPVHGACDR